MAPSLERLGGEASLGEQEGFDGESSLHFRLKPKGMLGKDFGTLALTVLHLSAGFGEAGLSGLGKPGMPWGFNVP